MAVSSVRMSEEEERLFRSYCQLHGISISEAFKRALMEKIEDEFDLAEFEIALKEFEENPVTHTLEELREAYKL